VVDTCATLGEQHEWLVSNAERLQLLLYDEGGAGCVSLVPAGTLMLRWLWQVCCSLISVLLWHRHQPQMPGDECCCWPDCLANTNMVVCRLCADTLQRLHLWLGPDASTLSCQTAHNHCVPCRPLEAIKEFFSYCYIGQEPLIPAMLRDPEGTHVDLLLLLQRKVEKAGFVPPENAVKCDPEVMAVGTSILPYSARHCAVRRSFRTAFDRNSLTVQSPCLAAPRSLTAADHTTLRPKPP
jgi:hypothetical protein